jgi:ubiquinone/menaquinone biosynthesis C-methylase UbiE
LKDYDKSHWHYIQAPEEIFLLRKYDFNDDNRQLLSKWLGLGRSNLRIVEMGSGSGYFTEQILLTTKEPEIICIEPDDDLRRYAKKLFGEGVVLKKGFVENPPLADNVADLVICHALLCNVPDIKAAVNGMIKVAKPNGVVCSIEPTFLDGFSTDPRVKLIVEGHSANIEGAWKKRKNIIDYPKEYPYDKYIFPLIFAQCNLRNINVHSLSTIFYSGSNRQTRDNIIQEAKEWLDLLENHKVRYEANLKRAGWKKDKIRDFFIAWREYYEEEVRNPSNLSEDLSVYMKCSIVTIGQK